MPFNDHQDHLRNSPALSFPTFSLKKDLTKDRNPFKKGLEKRIGTPKKAFKKDRNPYESLTNSPAKDFTNSLKLCPGAGKCPILTGWAPRLLRFNPGSFSRGYNPIP